MDHKSQLNESYIHGYSRREQKRLYDQAVFLEPYVYDGVDFTSCKRILEVGCGVGAQTAILHRRFPKAQIWGVDMAAAQVEAARQFLARDIKKRSINISQQDATRLSFDRKSFDGAFICWLLEHVPDPLAILKEVRRTLKPGGAVYCSEVQNESLFLDPYCPAILQYWHEFNDFQLMMGGDPFVGVKLGNLFKKAQFKNIDVEVRPFLLDGRNRILRDRTIRYFQKIFLSGAPSLLRSRRISQNMVDNMNREFAKLVRLPDSIFFFTWIRGCATA